MQEQYRPPIPAQINGLPQGAENIAPLKAKGYFQALPHLFIAFAIAACGPTQQDKEQASDPDQCLRVELFERCMKSLPAGPKQTQYNDWAEVVSECQSASYYQSMRSQKHIKPECRWKDTIGGK